MTLNYIIHFASRLIFLFLCSKCHQAATDGYTVQGREFGFIIGKDNQYAHSCVSTPCHTQSDDSVRYISAYSIYKTGLVLFFLILN